MKKMLDFLHHLFIPKETNNFRAKALHTDFLTYYLLIALFFTFVVKQTNLTHVLGFATDISIPKLYQLTNDVRSKNGLPSLTYNEKLADAATRKAQDMFSRNYWSHYGPNGKTPWDFILSANYQYEYAGENLAKNFLFSQGVVDAWMNSPTHRENLLRSNYTEVGFSVVNGILNGEQTTLVIQMFGKPLGSSVTKDTNTSSVQTQPAIQITTAPQPIITQVPVPQTVPAVLAKESNRPSFSLANLSLNINLVFLVFLMLALLLDFYFASKMNIVRIGGKNMAHFIFIGFIVIGLVFLTRGAIL